MLKIRQEDYKTSLSRTLILSLTTKNPYAPNTIKTIPITLNHRLIVLQTGTALMANKRVSQQLLTLEHRLERQSDTIKNIQENVDNASKYQDLRQDVLKSQGSTINRWLSVISIFLMVLGAYGFFVVKDKIKVLDKLVKESESVLAVTKTHSKNAKKYEEEAKVSAATAKKLANPEVKLTKKTEQEVKKSGFFISVNGFLILS
jgi:predicted ribosome quality control (RQC) complex YloA/Tae2 family protein